MILGSAQRCGSGHTSITNHGHSRSSVAGYGSHSHVGRWPGSTKVEGGACLMAGVCLNPEISPDTMGVPEKPAGGLVHIREGHVPVRLGSPGREVPIGSRRAGGLWGLAVGKPTWVSAASTSTSM